VILSINTELWYCILHLHYTILQHMERPLLFAPSRVNPFYDIFSSGGRRSFQIYTLLRIKQSNILPIQPIVSLARSILRSLWPTPACIPIPFLILRPTILRFPFFKHFINTSTVAHIVRDLAQKEVAPNECRKTIQIENRQDRPYDLLTI
jgi:hypothetical protein